MTRHPHGAPNYYQYGNNVWPVNTFDTALRPHETYSTIANNSNYWLLYITDAWNTNSTLGSLWEGYGPAVTWSNMTWYNGSFGYDHLNRLTSAGDAGWSRAFGYDQYGNMSVTSSSNVPTNGLTPVNQGSNPYNPANNRLLEGGYDAAGNMGTVGALSFWYDAEGRQTQSYDAGSHTTVLYTYDADGQRVQKAVSNGLTTVYIHDAFGQLAAEYASSVLTPPCTTCYLSYDHLGSVRLITDQNAQVISRHDYLPFGEEIPNGSGGRSGNGFGAFSNVNQMFTGQERDGEMVPNVDFFNARYFMGVLGNFTSPDPANAGADLYNPQSWNAYAYVLGNPLNGVDPSGMWWCDPEDPSCDPWWPPPFPPCFFFDCGGGGGGGGNGNGGSGGPNSNTPRSTPLPPNSFPGGETLGLPPGMRVPLPSPAVLLGLNLNLNCEFGVCVGGVWSPWQAAGSGGAGSSTQTIWDHCGSSCGAILDVASNFAAGAGDFLSFGFTTRFNQWTGAQSAVDTNSSAYNAGIVTGLGVAAATGALGTGKALAGLETKIAIHDAHHTFALIGRVPHLQIMWWLENVRKSGQVIRIPLTPWWP